MMILHTTTQAEWERCKQQELFGQAAKQKDGFIHCSDIHTFHTVAPKFNNTEEAILLLLLDSEKITADVVWEDLKGSEVTYPHVYGLINRSAVVAVLPFLRDAEENWIMNEELKKLL